MTAFVCCPACAAPVAATGEKATSSLCCPTCWKVFILEPREGTAETAPDTAGEEKSAPPQEDLATRVRNWLRKHSSIAVIVMLGAGLATYCAAKAFGVAARDGNTSQSPSACAAADQAADREATRADKIVYARQVRTAQHEWKAGRAAVAWLQLNDSRWDLRDWEYRYLSTLFTGNRTTLRGHSGTVHSVAFSPDGKRLVSGGGYLGKPGQVKVWDAVSGEELLSLQGHADAVFSVAFSADGKRIVSGGGGIEKPGEVKVWDASTGQELLSFQAHARYILSLAFSPVLPSARDSQLPQRIATTSADGTLKVWDAGTGKELLDRTERPNVIRRVAFSPDGKRLIGGGADHTVTVWDAVTGRTLLSLKGHEALVNAVACSPDGQRFASASVDRTLKVWDARTGREVLSFKGHTRWIASLAFSPDGLRLVTGGQDHCVKVWDALTGQEVGLLTGHTGAVLGLAFSPDGKTLATASADKTLKIWDLRQRPAGLSLWGHAGGVNGLAVSPDGKRLVSAGKDNKAIVWDARTGQQLFSLAGHTASVSSVACGTPAGARIVSGSQDGTLKVWEARTGRELMTLRGHTAAVHSVAFHPAGEAIVSGGGPGELKLWDAVTGQERLSFRGHTGPVYAVAFSPDGAAIVSASGDGTVKVWNAGTGLQLFSLHGHSGPVWSVAFSPDGKAIVSGAGCSPAEGLKRGEVKVWDAHSGKELHSLKGHADAVTCVAFSPSGKRIVSGGRDHSVKVWDADEGQELLTLNEHTGTVTSVAFGPMPADAESGRSAEHRWRLFSASADSTIRILDADQERECLPLARPISDVAGISFTPDGQRLLVKEGSGRVLSWDMRTGRCGPVAGDAFPDNDLTLSPDGRLRAELTSSMVQVIVVAAERERLRRDQELLQRLAAFDADWHRAQARAAHKARQPFALAFHLDRLLRENPWDAKLQVRRALALTPRNKPSEAVAQLLGGLIVSLPTTMGISAAER